MMKIVTKGRLAVIAMLDLALRTDHGPVALASIGARQKISLSYLESLFARLRQRGLVRSTRGPGGGYGLARNAVDITMAEIVLAVDEPRPSCTRAAAQPSSHGHPPDQRIASDWDADLERTMVEFLVSVSLQDMAEAQRRLGQASMSAVCDSGGFAIDHRRPSASACAHQTGYPAPAGLHGIECASKSCPPLRCKSAWTGSLPGL